MLKGCHIRCYGMFNQFIKCSADLQLWLTVRSVNADETVLKETKLNCFILVSKCVSTIGDECSQVGVRLAHFETEDHESGRYSQFSW